MKWYFKIAGGHTHVRVFMNGAKCGDLCFRNEEFDLLRRRFSQSQVEFIDETPKEQYGTTKIWNLTGEPPQPEMTNPAA